MAVAAGVERLALIDDPAILRPHEDAREARRTAPVRVDRGVLRDLSDVEALVTGKVADRRPAGAALVHGQAVRGVGVGDVGHGSSGHDWHQ